uniref:Serine aminopeptidase S33 domain-containing protein n=1 Tax=Panagrolaimus davidi TaxID=227884 RepID=A0A914PR95_9BILA
MYEKYLNEENELNLFKIPVTIKTKNRDAVKLDAIIQDTKPDGTSFGTVICSHGAPGCHRDFRRLYPYLEKDNVRVISINFPGCGYTKCKNQCFRKV